MEALRAQLTEKLAEKSRLQAQLIETTAHIKDLTRAMNKAVRDQGNGDGVGSRKKKRASSSESEDSSDSDSPPKALADTVEALVVVPALECDPAPVPVPVLVPAPIPDVVPVPAPLPAVEPVRVDAPATGRGRPRGRPTGPQCERCWNIKQKKAGGKHSRDEYCENLTRLP